MGSSCPPSPRVHCASEAAQAAPRWSVAGRWTTAAKVLPRTRIAQRIEALKAAGQWRDPTSTGLNAASAAGATRLIDVRSNDYLGLAGGLVSRETAPSGRQVRSGAGAARSISGTWPQHLELEERISEWLQVESVLLFSSGYAANVGVLSALAGPGETIFSDALNHASIVDGCRLSRADVVVLPHGDLGALSRALDNTQGVRWVVTESYFGMDGDCPDLRGIASLCAKHEAALIVDEAHALGVFGREGRGLCEEAGVTADVLVGGMGKALGVHGGFAACSNELRGWLWNRARSFVFSTAPSPLLCDVALDHLRRLRGADAARSRLRELEARLEAALRLAGVPLPRGRRGPIFPVIFGDERITLDAAAALRSRGVHCQPIRPPTVPRGGSRLRITLRSELAELDVDAVAVAVVEVWRGAADTGAVTGWAAAGAVRLSAASPSDGAVNGALAGGRAPNRSGGLHRDLAPTSARRWIVLGTGTGVGKTFVAEGLVRALRAVGSPVAGLKPIETGLDHVSRQGSDAARLQAASFHVKHPALHPLYGYGDPVSPALAARRAGSFIDLDAVSVWLEEAARLNAATAPVLVVETAGGVFSPLAEQLTNLDLAHCLGEATWVLVAPDRLGVLHDVLSTLRAMEATSRCPDWLVLSAPESPDATTGTNLDELRRLGVQPRLLRLPRNGTDELRALLDP